MKRPVPILKHSQENHKILDVQIVKYALHRSPISVVTHQSRMIRWLPFVHAFNIINISTLRLKAME